MTLSRLKAQAQVQAVRKFTDREAASTTFSVALEKCTRDPALLCVLTFYGIGGIGKTSVLRHIHRRVTDSIGIPVVSIDLEAAHYSSQLDYLLDIRRQLQVSAPLFDYAVARFVNVSGRSLQEINRSWVPEDSLLYDLQEVACDLAEVVAPARLIRRLLSRAGAEGQRRLGKLKKDFEKIDALDDDRLAGELPAYLGDAIAASNAKATSPAIIFLDSVECLWSRGYFRLTKEDPDTWLRELIACSMSGLWLLAGRNRIKWGDDQAEWNDYLEQHLVGPLDDADAEDFLRSFPIEDAGIREAIVHSANGVPLYLDLCASTYLMRATEGKTLRAADFQVQEQEVIRRFLAHLEPEQREAVRALSLLHAFDLGLFSAVNRGLNIGIPDTLFEDFCATSYIESLHGSSLELYSIHRLVRCYLEPQVDVGTRMAIASVVIAEALDALYASHHDRATWLLREFGRVGGGAELGDDTTFAFLDTAVGLVDYGRWAVVQEVLDDVVDTPPEAPSMQAALEFLRGLCARKRGALEAAGQHYAAAADGAFRLGRYATLLRYHAAHASHLRGNYMAAAEVYEALAEQNDSGVVRFLARRQWADLAMLRGNFVDALAAFDGLLGAGVSDPLWDAETQRFRGHVQRFNFLLDEAEACYRDALRIAEALGADAMLGKVLTNLAEVRCWTQPKSALADAEEAVALNREVLAPIEVGKAMAALAIARAKTGRHEDGLKAADEAQRCQQETGYRAGVLFALLANGVCHAAAGNHAGVERALKDIRLDVSSLGVYGFLAEPLQYALHGTNYNPSSDYDWLAPDVAARIARTMPSLDT